jgi:hypothetical protein
MDCHSNETVWPWYSNVAPVKFFVARHVEEGREHLNLSTWGQMSARDQDHALEEIVEVLEEGEMPLKSYTATHADARLSDAQKQAIMDWASSQRAALRNSGAVSGGDEAGGSRSGEDREHDDDGH